MPKRKDENEIAFDALQQILRRDAIRDGIPQEPIPESKKLKYREDAGRKGGFARAKHLPTQKRKKIASKAAKTRWGKHK